MRRQAIFEPDNEWEGHYNRPIDPGNEHVREWNQNYLDFWHGKVKIWDNIMDKGIRMDRLEGNLEGVQNLCDYALTAEVLGNVVHAWEDYYAHAVLWKAQGDPGDGKSWPAWSASPAITGTPDSPNNEIGGLKPSSWSLKYFPTYCGEHPCLEEPPSTDPHNMEYGLRKGAATLYVQLALAPYIGTWFGGRVVAPVRRLRSTAPLVAGLALVRSGDSCGVSGCGALVKRGLHHEHRGCAMESGRARLCTVLAGCAGPQGEALAAKDIRISLELTQQDKDGFPHAFSITLENKGDRAGGPTLPMPLPGRANVRPPLPLRSWYFSCEPRTVVP